MVIFEKAVRTTSKSIILPDCFTESKRSSTKEQIGILEGSQLTSSQYLRAPALSVHNFILKIPNSNSSTTPHKPDLSSPIDFFPFPKFKVNF